MAVQPSDSPAGSKPSPGLYLVATPIGNLDDITVRALKLLAQVDCIACEDTRVTAKLLRLLGIKPPPLVSYHDHNAGKAGGGLLARLHGGQSVALVSDAGTPLLSDPGFPLVRDCLNSQIAVTALPGASALLAALPISGLPSERFLFAGFLPPKSAARRRALAGLADCPVTLIFYESPRRLAALLADMGAVLGDRPAAVAREMTKMFEEVRRGSLHDLTTHYATAGPPRGEVVVLVGGRGDAAPATEETLDGALRRALASATPRDAAQQVARETGLPKRTVYSRAVQMARES